MQLGILFNVWCLKPLKILVFIDYLLPSLHLRFSSFYSAYEVPAAAAKVP